MAEELTTLGPAAGRLKWTLAVVGCVALAVALLAGSRRGDSMALFMHAYLLNYCYVLSIALGALCFIAIGHACRAGWCVTVRRLCELLAAPMLLLAILGLPILAAATLPWGALYPWADPTIRVIPADAACVGRSGDSDFYAAKSAGDELLGHKAPYFNPRFFALRGFAYFLVWGWLARFFLIRSVRQDASGDPAETLAMERMAGPALLLLAVTMTFASFDWLMSLATQWSSTIFGVYFFSGAIVGFLAAVIVFALVLQAGGRLTESVTVEHYHDLGKLLFAFVIFWGYIAFSQYLLIWYANIPEESDWFLARQRGGWTTVSLVLLFTNLLIPFFGLLSREAKRRKAVLGFWAVWMLAAHWIDMYWLVMPSASPGGPTLGLIDVACLVGVGCLYVAGVCQAAEGRSLVPRKDPRLAESLAFENT